MSDASAKSDFEKNVNLTPLLKDCLKSWGIDYLTDIQQKAIEARIPLGESGIVCSPTSSGKTLIGELALINALSNGNNVLYLVSHKALAEQKYADFNKKFTEELLGEPISISLSTGDREEGDIKCNLLISTYEKALGLVLSRRLKVSHTVIIADELQILGEKGRGSSVETLCALLRQRQPHQFIGLTATVQNPEELAAWMNCSCIRSDIRDVDLIQTVRYGGNLHTTRFGSTDGETASDSFGNTDIYGVIRKLLNDGYGPVLIFTESRREALESAKEFSARCQRTADGIEICRQLELFSESTESSQQLMAHAERRITFHTADLTPEERTVIESGFLNSNFDVCFATSTLAAGVNFPFRTVIFPKLTYAFGDREGQLFERPEYRNMSGRAGRLGMHDDGRVLLLPGNIKELRHANKLVLPDNDKLFSQLVTLSMRKIVLSLIAARAVSTKDELNKFFENTLFWHMLLASNSAKCDDVLNKASMAIDWLQHNQFIEAVDSSFAITSFGRATFRSGLDPATSKKFFDLYVKNKDRLENDFDSNETALIHWAMVCPEFTAENPSRFLPWPSGQIKPECSLFMSRAKLLLDWDRADDQVTRCVHAMSLYMQGVEERKIQFATGVSSGYIHRLAIDLSWIFDGMSCISGAAELNCPQTVTNRLSMLARRIRWGVPIEALDILRIAKRQNVPGFGRQRIMALFTGGIKTVIDVFKAGVEKISKILESDVRTNKLMEALSENVDKIDLGYETLHMQIASELQLTNEVRECYNNLGTDYENAVSKLLEKHAGWKLLTLDDGKRQNVPDILLKYGSESLLIECKTVTKKPALIGKDEAFAVLQKSVDFDRSMKRITLGKPEFDETSKKKAVANAEVTLIRHEIFMEALLRVLSKRMSDAEFIAWLSEPGVSDLNRMPGTPTYVS